MTISRWYLCTLFTPCLAQAHGIVNLTEWVVVEGRRVNLHGEASSASQGVVGQNEIDLRPLSRTGEVLELIPGMVVTQHSGSGKANQYFLRGFNLDHGTDFATSVDGMPVNMRTHGHGQGYSDLNFVIPETVHNIQYQKGSYYADVGDFSGAGSAAMQTLALVDLPSIELSAGEHGYLRSLVLGGFEQGERSQVYALELNRYDGPWTDIDEDLRKLNALAKFKTHFAGGELQVGVMGYSNQWTSADQIPSRAVTSSLIDELGSLDTTTGGESSRYSINLQWLGSAVTANLYAIGYDLNLWSNFTYFLDDETAGDQFEQVDERSIFGGQLSHQSQSEWLGRAVSNRYGVEMRLDAIDEVGLYKSIERMRNGAIRSDEVDQFSNGFFIESEINWSGQLRSVLGLRYDYYHFDVNPLIDVNVNDIALGANGGTASDDIASLKGSLVYALSDAWETYLSAGQGFHSNDARGTTITVDPADGGVTEPVDPLVRSLGYEVGMRGFVGERINTSVALWALDVDSELLFVGDAGNTEASRASARQGIELTAYYRINESVTADLEYAWTHARFSGFAEEGTHIPGALEHVLQAGVSARLGDGWLGSLRLRYFGERPLIENNSVRSDPSTVVNFSLGYVGKRYAVKADVLNLFDSNDHDIDYFYESRLVGEPSGAGIEDIHYHVLEPRALRVAVKYHF